MNMVVISYRYLVIEAAEGGYLLGRLVKSMLGLHNSMNFVMPSCSLPEIEAVQGPDLPGRVVKTTEGQHNSMNLWVQSYRNNEK